MLSNIIFGILIIIFGIIMTFSLIYHWFVIPKIPKSDKWQRIRVKTVGSKTYIEKNVSGTRALPPYRKETYGVITYTVNGVTYEKTVPDGGVTHIFIRKSNPHYFRTMAEIKGVKHKSKADIISTVALIIISLCTVAFGVFVIFTAG